MDTARQISLLKRKQACFPQQRRSGFPFPPAPGKRGEHCSPRRRSSRSHSPGAHGRREEHRSPRRHNCPPRHRSRSPPAPIRQIIPKLMRFCSRSPARCQPPSAAHALVSPSHSGGKSIMVASQAPQPAAVPALQVLASSTMKPLLAQPACSTLAACVQRDFILGGFQTGSSNQPRPASILFAALHNPGATLASSRRHQSVLHACLPACPDSIAISSTARHIR